ncbi:hypothetical protein AUC71_06905 [Methyloceanibacter marginalis]|uniref:Uncharacterized protein n=1 Tax=Methyloceanibacter marginalis TaxID=1774971 RepID=A0A1E3WDR0_9HYPH|nr:hypothetical protein AUC71_06905 [Methyloceanibacter marginalis]
MRKPGVAKAAEAAATPDATALLQAVFSGSGYLAALAQRSPDLLADCLTRDPDTHLDEAREALAEEVAQRPAPRKRWSGCAGSSSAARS